MKNREKIFKKWWNIIKNQEKIKKMNTLKIDKNKKKW